MKEEKRQGVNWILICGVSLPAVMLAGFMIYSYLARSVAEPPAFDAVFSMYSGGPGEQLHAANLSYLVEEDRIVVRASALPEGARWTQALYRLNHETLLAERIELTVPDDVSGYAQVVTVPEVEHLRVTNEVEAPDGYRFRSGGNDGPGLIGMLFSPRRRDGVTIEKLGVVHRVEFADGVKYPGYAQFLGWVVE